MKIGLTEDDARAAGRAYLSDNRDIWKKLGYRMIGSQVHDDDRRLVLAELEVRKFQRLAMTAEAEDTEVEILHLISLRNMAKPPTKEQRTAAMDATAQSIARKEVQHFLEQSRHYLRKYTNVHNNYDKDAPYESKVRMGAKGVAYLNLGTAYYKLAVERLEHAGKTTIFGLRGEDTPPLGDNGD